MDSQVNVAAAPSRPRRVNRVHKDTFLDRRLDTEAYWLSLEENQEVNGFPYNYFFLVSEEKNCS